MTSTLLNNSKNGDINSLALKSDHRQLNGVINVDRMIGIDLNEPVGETSFTFGYMIKSLVGTDNRWDSLLAKRRLIRVEVKQISGIGYLSYIYRIYFHFEKTPTPFTAILKVPTIVHLSTFATDENFLRDFAVNLTERHNKECHFYEEFADKMKQLHLAKLYNYRKAKSPLDLESACILMEDLDVNGVMGSTVGGLNKKQVDNVIKALAQIHAISLSIPNNQEVIESFHWTNAQLDQGEGQAKWECVKKLYLLEHDYFRRHRKTLEKIASKYEIMHFDSHKHFGIPAVLCHGDMWANNIFFEKNLDGTASDELYSFVDWQFAHPNSGLMDVARMILLCVNASIKLRYLEGWLQLYYNCFEEHCRKLGVKCPYTLDLVRRMFRFHYPSEMLFSFVIIMQHYTRIEDDGIRTALLGRMLSSFESMRRVFEQL